ncbi:MAG: uroporphyrinogen decarboxylase family protein [Negativicutes bacterium]|nr:uroporphyrinogen decarboxylase family protein [Negativicutes bacterium]MDR3591194.1 uroporphyrinogen decarboxylase family protein [Negativicutes bacterium]
MDSYREILAAIEGRRIDARVPVCLWTIGQTYAPFAKIPDDKYYASPETMLSAQLLFHENFPDTFTVPGIWPDMGLVPELGAMGCQLEFLDYTPPHVRKTAFDDITEAQAFVPPDPRRADYTATVLDYLKYFKKNLPSYWQEKMGYLDGHVFCGGPGEISALMVGYDKYSYAMVDTPELVHVLARKVTDFLKAYIDAQLEIVGPLKRAIVWDHFPGMLSASMYQEFVHPYLKELFEHVNSAEIRVYHNENNYPHLTSVIRDIGANVVHIGPKHDLVQTRDGLDKCVMGNVHPVQDMLEASEPEFIEKCRQMIKSAGPGGRFLLSTAGGMAPETTLERMKLLLKVAAETEF